MGSMVPRIRGCGGERSKRHHRAGRIRLKSGKYLKKEVNSKRQFPKALFSAYFSVTSGTAALEDWPRRRRPMWLE
jgi:hypothetical protein